MNITISRLIGTIKALDPAISKQLDLLIDLATEKGPLEIRLAALSMLDKDICPQVVAEIAAEDPEPAMRLAAVMELGPDSDPHLMDIISKHDENPHVRLAAKAIRTMQKVYEREDIKPKQVCEKTN